MAARERVAELEDLVSGLHVGLSEQTERSEVAEREAEELKERGRRVDDPILPVRLFQPGEPDVVYVVGSDPLASEGERR